MYLDINLYNSVKDKCVLEHLMISDLKQVENPFYNFTSMNG